MFIGTSYNRLLRWDDPVSSVFKGFDGKSTYFRATIKVNDGLGDVVLGILTNEAITI